MMTAFRRQFRARLELVRTEARRDDGTSLVELVVGMTLMLSFMAMFTGAILMMSSTMNNSQAIGLTSSQLNNAFLTLDRTVRYAAAISTPGATAAGNWYVEFRTTNTGVEVCTQLRVDVASQQLQNRTWTVTNAVASTPSSWTPIASGIINGAAATAPAAQKPFYVPPVTTDSESANALYQQLTVNLASPSGIAGAATTSTSSFTFTAMNSSSTATSSSICQQQGRP